MRAKTWAGLCLLSMTAGTSAFSQTNAPATPTLTAGAIVKGLRFDWEPVAGASWYQLEYSAHKNAAFVQHGYVIDGSLTTTHYRFPLHLYDWAHARYRLAACNSVGCTRSAEISVSALRRFAVGYFKPAQSLPGQHFGADMDFAANRINYVSAAPDELIASGSGAKPGGAVYVFKFNGGVWRQRARIVPPVPAAIRGVNVMKVAISEDGFTVALGIPNYLRQASDERSGDVFVFHSDGTKFVRTRIPTGGRTSFGRWIGLSDAGDTLAIAHGVNSDPALPPRIAIFRLIDGTWTQVRGIASRAGHDEICDQGVLSADGSTVAESCEEGAVGSTPARVYIRTHSGENWSTRADLPLQMSVPSESGYGHRGIGIDRTGNIVAAQIFARSGSNPDDGPAEVHVFEREDGVYEKEAVLTPGAWRSNAQRSAFGQNIAISGNGIVLAVSDALDNGLGDGPRSAPLIAGTARTGAVYVYRYRNDWWYLYNMVKPNYHPENTPYLSFGNDLEFDHDGIAMLVGESGESSNAQGISGNWENVGAPAAGAVWLY
jgi:hypothetical protein